MAKKQPDILLTNIVDIVSGLVSVQPRGPIVPVRRGEQVRWLQDGRYIPAWLVWLQRRKFGLLLALLVLAGLVVAAVRLLLGGKSDGP